MCPINGIMELSNLVICIIRMTFKTMFNSEHKQLALHAGNTRIYYLHLGLLTKDVKSSPLECLNTFCTGV